MNTEELKLLYAYNDWADKRILNACAKVSLGQYAAPASFGIGYGSLHATMLHILNSERGWRLLCMGASEVNWDELTQTDFPTPQGLEGRWQQEEQAMRSYLGALTEGDLQGVIRYSEDNGIVRERILWHCLVHLVNHGTQHRSEAAVALTSYGQSPGDIDFTLFLNEYFKMP